jgi:hypothetical protein
VWSCGVTPVAVILTSTLHQPHVVLVPRRASGFRYPVNDSPRIALIMTSPFLAFARNESELNAHASRRLCVRQSCRQSGAVSSTPPCRSRAASSAHSFAES